jgi:hypothetical protein
VGTIFNRKVLQVSAAPRRSLIAFRVRLRVLPGRNHSELFQIQELTSRNPGMDNPCIRCEVRCQSTCAAPFFRGERCKAAARRRLLPKIIAKGYDDAIALRFAWSLDITRFSACIPRSVVFTACPSHAYHAGSSLRRRHHHMSAPRASSMVPGLPSCA